MENVFYWGNLILSYGITGYVMLKFMHAMYKPKCKSRIFVVATYIIFVSLSIIINILGIPILKTIYGVISICIISFLLFREKPKKKMLVYDLVFFLYIIWMDGISVLGIAFITGRTILNVRESISLIFLSGISSQILILCTYRFMIIFFKKHSIKSIALQQNLFLTILALFEIMLVTYMMLKVEASSQGGMLVFVIVCLLSLDIYLIYLFEAISQKYELEKEINLKEQQATMQNNYYQSIEIQYDHSRRLIHDMKNHMQTLEELYNSGSGTEAKHYAQTILEGMDALSGRFKCKNRILTIIVNDKILKCDELGIELNIEVEDIDFNFIESFDMTTIFSNLLDNAIEACTKIPIERRIIVLRVFKFNQFVTISIRNQYNGDLAWDKDALISTKGGKHMGLGLKNVKSAVEKYDGTIQRKSNNEFFEVKILLSPSA